MTSTPAPSGEMDHLDQLGAKAFDGAGEFPAELADETPLPEHFQLLRIELS
jgi:hypothetical protein